MTIAPAFFAVEHLTVRFGGRVAVDDVSMHAGRGSVTGIIGPNGAGKTTTLNACTGLVQSAAGTVQLGGLRLDSRASASRARRGLGRTFQRTQLFDSMTAEENVAMGSEMRRAGRRLTSYFWGPRRERIEREVATREAMARCGIGHLALRRAGTLSTGERRLVELARVIAGGFQLLLLDEPSSGLDVAETAHLGRVLLELTADGGPGVVLVEHDMALIRQVCRYVYVLEFGRLIDNGPVSDVLASAVVRAAYLGSAGAEEANSRA